MERKTAAWAAGLFLLALAPRLIISLHTTEFSSDNAYFVLRQAEHIADTGLPQYIDPYSFGGIKNAFLPAYHYIIALFSLLTPLWLAAKLGSNILGALAAPAGFLLAYRITKKTRASIIAGLAASFSPIYLASTVNTASVMNLMAPLVLAGVLLYFESLRNNNAVKWFIAVIALASLSHVSAAIFIIGSLLYLAMCRTDRLPLKKEETELILFSAFLSAWITLIFFKQPLLALGPGILKLNAPRSVLTQMFPGMSIVKSFTLLGPVGFASALFVAYRSFFSKKSKQDYFLLAISLSALALLVTRLVPLRTGLVYLGVLFGVFAGEAYSSAASWVSKTRFRFLEKHFFSLVLVVLVLSQAAPAISLSYDSLKKAPSREEVQAYLWLRSNAPEDAVVLATLSEGHKIAYFARRKNVIDANFLTAPLSQERLENVQKAYTTSIKVNAIEVLQQYSVDYIVFSREAKSIYGRERLDYATPDCFELVFENRDAQIYRSKCVIK